MEALASRRPLDVAPEQWRTARRCLSVLALLGSLGLVGVASSMFLVNHFPLLLIALSPIGRHLILVAAIVDPMAFVFVAVTRRLLFYATCFQLGRSIGPAGIVWVEARAARMGRFIRWIERCFDRASHAVVFFLAGPTVSTLAGSSGMRSAVFLPLAAAGLVLRMLLVLGLADWLREPILALLAWVDEHWIPGTAVLVAAVALYRWRTRGRGVPVDL